MSRRAHVVRAEASTGPAMPRSDDCAPQFLCHTEAGAAAGTFLGPDESHLIGPIPVTVTTDFQRIFISATINGVAVWQSE